MTSIIQLPQNLFFHSVSLLAQVEYSTEGKAPSPASTIVGLLIALFLIVAMWKVFTKAGQPGWASIILIYNLYVWCKIVGRPWWWILLMLIPFVNFIILIILCIDMAKSFGKGAGLESVSLSWESSSGRYLASEALNIKDQQLRSRQSKGCSSPQVAKFASHSDAATVPISVVAFR